MTKKAKPVAKDEIDLGIMSGATAQAHSAGELVASAETVTAMAESLGYDGQLSVGALEDGIRLYQRRTVEDLLELGKRLLLLKELTPHGEFTPRLESLGIAKHTALRFMQAAAKCAKSNNLLLLSSQVKNASVFLELITHDDEVLESLANMDEIDTMSASEVRAYARRLETEGMEEVATLKRRENNYEAELERAELQIKRLSESKKRLTDFEPRTEEIRQECMALQLEAELPINSLQKLFEEVVAESKITPESRLRIEQVWVAANIVAASALDTLAKICDFAAGTPDGNDLPVRALGAHILTPQEAEHWLLSRPMIENRHAAEKALRQEKREADKPQGRGRPKGSKNKADGE